MRGTPRRHSCGGRGGGRQRELRTGVRAAPRPNPSLSLNLSLSLTLILTLTLTLTLTRYEPLLAGADAALRDEAVAVARAAESVVLICGLPSSCESEGFDRTHLGLPQQMVELIELTLTLTLPLTPTLTLTLTPTLTLTRSS